jgi:hypothetical protein
MILNLKTAKALGRSVKRREFIAGLGSAAWPVVTRAQQRQRMRRIGERSRL